MHRYWLSCTCFLLAVVLFSACSRLPDHARYIPKDAVAVAGVNLKALSKKIAWNVITGSKLFKEMQSRLPQKNARNAVSGIEKAGLDVANTFYIYVKSDARFNGNNRVTALVPLSDASQWEAYIKTSFPDAEIKQHGDRKEASLGLDMYVGWNKKLLILMDVLPASDYTTALSMARGGGSNAPDRSTIDLNTISMEMDKAFTVTDENSIINNKRFTALEMEGHDVTFWLNYDQLMTEMNGDVSEKTGMNLLSSDIWKDAAFAAGFDFRMGKITSDMRYYLGAGMKDLGPELGGTNADPDMISRLPSQNLDMLAAGHISPKGLKAMLEKMNLLGLANTGLSTQDMTVEYVLDAFTGDMAFVMNDFSLHAENEIDTFLGQPVVHQNQKPSLDVSYAIKINKRENFQKIVDLAKQMGLQAINNGYVVPINDKDSVYILMNNQYLVSSNKYADADGFLKGTFKSQPLPSGVSSQVNGYPVSFYFDVQQFCKNIDEGISHSARDSFMISETKKLLSNISFNGGAFKDDAFQYHLDINFTNTEENSIIELLDYSMKMNDAGKLSE